MKLLESSDCEEHDNPSLSKQEIIDKIDSINKRIGQLQELKQEVAINGAIYETNPDSKIQ